MSSEIDCASVSRNDGSVSMSLLKRGGFKRVNLKPTRHRCIRGHRVPDLQ